jgi:hypothetical protein
MQEFSFIFLIHLIKQQPALLNRVLRILSCSFQKSEDDLDIDHRSVDQAKQNSINLLSRKPGTIDQILNCAPKDIALIGTSLRASSLPYSRKRGRAPRHRGQNRRIVCRAREHRPLNEVPPPSASSGQALRSSPVGRGKTLQPDTPTPELFGLILPSTPC